jgi:hypothetical protein
MTDQVTKAKQTLEALDGAQGAIDEQFAKAKDDAADAYMARVEQIRKDANVSLLEAHRIAQTDPVAAEAYERTAQISDDHGYLAGAVPAAAARIEE